MRWDDVVQAVVSAMNADAALTTALGGQHIFRAGALREPRIPSVEYTVVAVTQGEVEERVAVQFDIWARGQAQAVTIEARLWALFHHDTPASVGGLAMWAQQVAGRDHGDPEPGVVHRSTDFLFAPARAGR